MLSLVLDFSCGVLLSLMFHLLSWILNPALSVVLGQVVWTQHTALFGHRHDKAASDDGWRVRWIYSLQGKNS